MWFDCGFRGVPFKNHMKSPGSFIIIVVVFIVVVIYFRDPIFTQLPNSLPCQLIPW